MKVCELKEALEGLDDQFEVIVAADAEGNAFRSLDVVDGDNTSYVMEDRCIELRIASLTPELEESGFTEEDVDEDAAACVVLWPS